MVVSNLVKKNKIKRVISSGIVHINATFNNTTVVITDVQGNVLSFAASGVLGFKGAKKSTPYVAQLVAEKVAKKAINSYGMRTVSVQIKGPGSGRESAVRSLVSIGLCITTIIDVTPIPHNGCRPPKKRRG